MGVLRQRRTPARSLGERGAPWTDSKVDPVACQRKCTPRTRHSQEAEVIASLRFIDNWPQRRAGTPASRGTTYRVYPRSFQMPFNMSEAYRNPF